MADMQKQASQKDVSSFSIEETFDTQSISHYGDLDKIIGSGVGN